MLRPLLLLAIITLHAAPPIYKEIRDLKHPTWSDYRKIQNYLKKGERPELSHFQEAIEPGGNLMDYDSRARRFRLVGKWPWQGAKFKTIPFNCSLNDKKICVLTYASYNQNFPAGIEAIKAALQKINFKGHFIYRIGGWPNLEDDSLQLAHIPYAFKPCFLKEVEKLGYECVLWLDSSIRPMKNLDAVFKTIETQGYLFYPAGHTLAKYCTQSVMEALSEPIENAATIPSVAAGLFGLNLRHPLGRTLMEQWYQAAHREIPFFSPRSDQNVLSILISQLHLTHWEQTGLDWNQCTPDTRFFIDYPSVR